MSGGWRQRILFTFPKSKNSPLSRTGFFRQFSLFCLVITSYNVKGYAAFHKLRPLMRCPKFFAHSRLHSRFLLCKNRCCDEPCFAARNRLTAENDRTLIGFDGLIFALTFAKAKTALFRGLFFSSMFPFLPCYNFIQCKGVRYVSQNFDR